MINFIYFLSIKALVLAVVVIAFMVTLPTQAGNMGVPLIITLGIVFAMGLHVATVLKAQESRIAKLENRDQPSTLN